MNKTDRTPTSRHGGTSARQEIASLVRYCFSRYGRFKGSELQSVPVDDILRYWLGKSLEIRTVYSQDQFALHSSDEMQPMSSRRDLNARAVWVERHHPNGSNYEIWLRGDEADTAQRFSLAHELGHFMLQKNPDVLTWIATTTGKPGTLVDIEEQLANEFASQFLLPDSVVRAHFDTGAASREGLSYLETFAKTMRIGLQLLAKRLDQMPLDPEQWFFLTADRTVALRSRQTLALRVRTRVCPKGYFFPFNRRLSSLGLDSLVALFPEMKPFCEEEWEGRISMQRRSVWKTVTLPARMTAKKYVTRNGFSYLAVYGQVTNLTV